MERITISKICMEGHVRRKGLLISLIIFLFILMNPAIGKAQGSASLNLTGYLQALAIDEVDETTGVLISGILHYLKAEDNKVYRLDDPKKILKEKLPGKINVRGMHIDSKTILVDEVKLIDSKPSPKALAMGETLPESIGEQRTLVVLFNYPDKPYRPFTIGEMENRILASPDSIDNFIRENSYGKTWLNADFIDWQTLPNNSTDYIGVNFTYDLLEDSINTIDSVVDFQTYGRLIFVYIASDTYSLGGRGTVGKWNLSSPGDGDFEASVIWMGEAWAFCSAIAHEFGHNLGFWHASSVFSIPESLLDPTYSTGVWGEYYDTDDTMGGGYNHFSSIRKTKAQWIEPLQIQDAVNSGQYVLDQFELPSSGLKVLKIPIGKDRAGNDTFYWVEYRKNNRVFDPVNREDSVQIRVEQDSTYTDTDDSWPPFWSANSIKYKIHGSGGSISGRVTRDSDGTGIGNVEVIVIDPSWQGITSTKTNSFGNYRIGGLSTGGYFLKTENYLGYFDKYYDNVATQSAAKIVNVTDWVNTPNINFGLTPLYSLRSVGSGDQEIIRGGSLSSSEIAITANANIETDNPFHDAYRGIKIDFIEKTGTGIDSKVKLQVTLSGVDIDPQELLMFGTVGVNTPSSKPVTITNNSTALVDIGYLSIGGRNSGIFNISNDGCTNRSLQPGESCLVTIVCDPDWEGDKFGVLFVPNTDAIRPIATISLYAYATIGSDEAVSAPTTISGPISGNPGISYSFTVGGAISNKGHSVEYQFDWTGNSSDLSPWGSATQSKTWDLEGIYNIRIRARCTIHPSIVSTWATALSVTILNPETISTPSVPSGETSGAAGVIYTYVTGSALSDLGHPVQYLFNWGDGTDTGWLPVGTTSASKSWVVVGTYLVWIQARCATHTSVVSSWSSGLSVTISIKIPLNDTTEFVKQQYCDFLNREAETAGLQFWVNMIESGAMTRAQVIESFFWSQEFGATIAPVVRLYFAYFLRIPDYGGLMYWINVYKSGGSLGAISDSFAGSEEFQQTYGALSNEAFVNLVYQNILGRAPDPGGFAFWVGELNSGRRTRGQVMIGFSESAEYEGLTSHEVYVTMMYIGMLRRSPEVEGFNFWVNYLDSGNSGLALIDGFLYSQEYANRFQ